MINYFLKFIKSPNHTIDDVIKEVAKHHPKANLGKIREAFEFAESAHGEQKRASGEPYVQHPLETAYTLAEMSLPENIIIAGLLHDVPEDTEYTLADIEKKFGKDVAEMVEGITKLGKIKYRGFSRYAENLRKMFIAMAEDLRVILIKFADRLHNLKTLDALPPDKQRRIALETLEIYAPIAYRLGAGELKGQLEDLAFKYVYPEEYEWTLNILKEAREIKESYLNKVRKVVEKKLKEEEINYISVHGRAKHLYSLYNKLLKYNRNIDNIYDIVALRVIVPEISDCYTVLGLIHSLWKPVKGRIKDYIAQPKSNGYRSLHTSIFCENNEIVEFQIRTPDMHQQAEYGIAAHYSYKTEGEDSSPKTKWLKELLHLQSSITDNEKFLEAIKIDIFQDRIFVMTPNGDVLNLPRGSTPIDFAYHIHTWVGNHCTTAKVNNKIVKLDAPLENDDIVEILTDKNKKGPSTDWLKLVKTNLAKSEIRKYSKKLKEEEK